MGVSEDNELIIMTWTESLYSFSYIWGNNLFFFFLTASVEVGNENKYVQMKAIFPVLRHFFDFNNLPKSVISAIITIAS